MNKKRQLAMKRILIIFFSIIPLLSTAQDRLFTVLEYNVENLYDTLDDAGKDDAEFLPEGAKNWTQRRYWKKLGRMATVIAAAGVASPPDLVGLCEVENDTVLTHLTQRTRLKRLGYKYLLTQSEDPRGADVALLYQPMRFNLLHVEYLRINPPTENDRPTRDILHATGQVPSGDTLHVFLCHLPSRANGQQASEAYRCVAAQRIREACDKLFEESATPRILIMGDFNDEAHNRSIREVLRCIDASKTDTYSSQELYILSKGLTHANGARGSYKYRGEWNQLDHFIVSGILLHPHARFATSKERCELFCPAFLCEPDASDDTVRPKRTYLGTFYKGGFSDHFPLRLQFLF